jgi:glycerol transport system ATP-binding protein
MAQIDLKNIAHSYVATPSSEDDFALKKLDVSWQDGGAYALLGPSGCGKTTLLNIISGLLHPTQGAVLFNGADITSNPPEARNIAQVFQFPVIYDTMTVYQNLAFPLQNRKVPKREIDVRVRRLADMLELSKYLSRKARDLSADEKQKISLGRGLIREDVAAILFDEPLTVIDPQLKWSLRSQLKQLHAEFNHTMIYVTHDQTEALTFADQVIVMSEGEIVQTASPQELFERPAHTFVGRFIGSPGMNVLPCAIDNTNVVLAGHAVNIGRNVTLPSGAERIELGVRPEFVKISTDEKALPVTVEAIEDAGRYRIARLRLHDLQLAAILPDGAALPSGTTGVLFDAENAHIYADGHIVERRA